MKSIKDFFHNANDIVLAILIIAAATALIAWRLNIILDYPEKIAQETAVTSEESSESSESTKSTDTADTETSSSVETGSAFEDNLLTADVSFEVSSGNASEAAQGLIDAKLFTDYDQFASAASDAGLSPADLVAGSYSFSKGASVDDVLNKIM